MTYKVWTKKVGADKPYSRDCNSRKEAEDLYRETLGLSVAHFIADAEKVEVIKIGQWEVEMLITVSANVAFSYIVKLLKEEK